MLSKRFDSTETCGFKNLLLIWMETVWHFHIIISKHVIAHQQIFRMTWKLFKEIAKFAFFF